MQKKLLIFDWDGTIVDSIPKITECKKLLAERYQLPSPSHALVRSVIGQDFRPALRICFPSASEQTLDHLGQDFHQLMQTPDFQASPFEGSINVLNQLKGKDLQLSIATSKAKCEMNSALQHTGLEHTFDGIYCSETYQSKPNPAMLIAMMDQFSLEPKDCLMIGDTTIDMELAHNADIEAIAVTFGAHNHDTLNQYKPVVIIDHWPELPNVLRQYGI